MRRVLAAVAFLCLSVGMVAQVSVTVSPVAKQQFLGADGQPLPGGLLYTYSAGTSSPLATYTDSTGLSQNTNPVVLDGSGYTPFGLFLSANTYKFVLKDANGVTQWTIDGVAAGSITLEGKSWESPGAIGSVTPNTGDFTTLNSELPSLTFLNPTFSTVSEADINGASAATIYHKVEGGGTGAAEGVSGAIKATGTPGTGYQYEGVGGHLDCLAASLNCMGGYFENFLESGANVGWGINPVILLYPNAGSNAVTRNEATYDNYGPLEASDVHYAWDVTSPNIAGNPTVYVFHSSTPSSYASTIATATRLTNVSTFTLTGPNGLSIQPFSVGDAVTTAGVTDSSFDLASGGCVVSAANASSFSCSNAGADASSGSGTAALNSYHYTSLLYGEPGCCTKVFDSPVVSTATNSSSAVGQWHYVDATGASQVANMLVAANGTGANTGNFQFSGLNKFTVFAPITASTGGFTGDSLNGQNTGITLNALGTNQNVTVNPTGTGDFIFEQAASNRITMFASQDFSASNVSTQIGWLPNTATVCATDTCAAGTLGIAPRSSVANAHIIFATGNGTPAERMRITDAGTIKLEGPTIIGANGAVVNAVITFAGTLTFTAISAQTCQEQTVSVTNASTTNYGVNASPRASLGSTNLSWSAWVSASGAVSVRVCNPSSGTLTPIAVAWGGAITQ